jgi:ABC-2 type transport system permease protein
MTRLLRVELTRLRWRRAVLLLLAAAVVIPIVIGIATVWDTKPPSAEERANVDAMVAEETQQPYIKKQLRQCVKKPQQYGLDPQATDLQAQCEEITLPRAEWYADYRELNLVEERQQGSGLAVVVVISLLLVLAGTTFAGHDWNSGSMSNQLLFEPRRTRVWIAKGGVILGVAFTLCLVVITVYWLALFAVARSRDLPSGTGLLVDCLQMGLRGALVAGLSALGGFALTMLFRSTVATLGVLFAVTIAGGLLIAALGISERWYPQTNLMAVITDGATYYVEPPDECFGSRPLEDISCDGERNLSAAQGTAYLGPLLLVGGLASLVSFRRRDVP